ncbi:MAG TPA: hypothetical protein VFE47_31500 [Tepidisphaeraceae bacterium]|jgi:hypothetical protein|nr:hypothetical protein [Tepidisphaeraceae bacterium]
MVATPNTHPRSQQHVRTGKLLLKGVPVGSVILRGHDASWTFGEFTPFPEFSQFAALFGTWSLLMHAEDAGERLSEAASEELRLAEYAIDTIRATLLLESPEERRHLRQVNIDGPLIEWKE